MNTIIHNQISTDIAELKKDEDAGLYDYLGSHKFAWEQLERITAKMARERVVVQGMTAEEIEQFEADHAEDIRFSEQAEQDKQDNYNSTRGV